MTDWMKEIPRSPRMDGSGMNKEDLLLHFDLQFFADADAEGRTEKPTGRRLGKAQSEGQFARTRDLPAPLALLAVALLLRYWLPGALGGIRDFTAAFLMDGLMIRDPGMRDILNIIELAGMALLKTTWPVMVLAGLVFAFGDIIQVGFHFNFSFIKFNWGALKPDFTRFFMRMLPTREMLVELIKSVGKIAIVGWITYNIFIDQYGLIMETVRMGLVDGLIRIGNVAYLILWKTALVLLIFSIPDYFYQRHEFMENLKMSKFEVKEEHRQMDGDPQLKAVRRGRMMEIFRRRMLQNVPKADVVITNPTHYAVALRYDETEYRAPVCLAKGRDYIALRIRDIAEKAGVPVVENKYLARTLHDAVEVGEEIPTEFYTAVAEVLAHVYRLREGVGV